MALLLCCPWTGFSSVDCARSRGGGGGLIALWQVLADDERRLTGLAGQGSWELLAAW
jgi:hypothetical protein